MRFESVFHFIDQRHGGPLRGSTLHSCHQKTGRPRTKRTQRHTSGVVQRNCTIADRNRVSVQ